MRAPGTHRKEERGFGRSPGARGGKYWATIFLASSCVFIGVRAQGEGFRAWDLRLRVWGSRFGVDLEVRFGGDALDGNDALRVLGLGPAHGAHLQFGA